MIDYKHVKEEMDAMWQEMRILAREWSEDDGLVSLLAQAGNKIEEAKLYAMRRSAQPLEPAAESEGE